MCGHLSEQHRRVTRGSGGGVPYTEFERKASAENIGRGSCRSARGLRGTVSNIILLQVSSDVQAYPVLRMCADALTKCGLVVRARSV